MYLFIIEVKVLVIIVKVIFLIMVILITCLKIRLYLEKLSNMPLVTNFKGCSGEIFISVVGNTAIGDFGGSESLSTSQNMK